MTATKVYGRKFYADLETTARPSAQCIVPLVLELVDVRSVVDVGCGVGHWLEVCRENGVEDYFGIDGGWIEDDQIRIPRARFAARDLGGEFDLGRRFDLAICLEVAEHLDGGRARKLVSELCTLSSVVLFSAAIPHQGGLGHVNEQWPSYWAALFAEQDYRLVDAFRLRLWQNEDVAWWYRQNMVLYADETALVSFPKLRAAWDASMAEPLPLVHPDMYFDLLRRTSAPLQIRISRAVRNTIRSWLEGRRRR